MSGIERILHLRNFLWYNFFFWLILCLLDAIRTISFLISFDLPFTASLFIRSPLSSYLAFWIISFILFDVYIYSRRMPRRYFSLVHLSGSILFGLCHKILSGVIGLLLERLFLENETKTWLELIDLWKTTYFDIFGDMIMYWLVIGILVGLDYYQKFNDQNTRRLELESALGKAQLKSMKMQMNPHFLFNAFNTIAMMVRQNKSKEAIDMIGGLSDMFRMSLNKELRQFVPLVEEIKLLEKYLAIESFRYKDRLTIEWRVDESVLDFEVPSFVLQPVVENAFKHGISKTLDKAVLLISIRKESELLVLEIFNTGGGLSINWELQKDKGIGLSNTIDRLLRLYKENFKFLITEKDDGVSVILKLPIQSE